MNFETAADRAYNIICNMILKGELSQGERLTRRKMAEHTGVSVIPVIEALHRLENEGLVESRPHWGSRVITLSKETIRDRFALREAVECEVVRILTRHITTVQENQLKFLAEELDSTSRESENIDLYSSRHCNFHLTMAQYTDCPSLSRALRNINLFRLLSKALAFHLKRDDEIKKDLHMRVVRGILSHDPKIAEQAMREHIYDSGLVTEEEV